jgi:hypothetical protein
LAARPHGPAARSHDAAIAVTGAQVRDGSLTGRDVRNSSLTTRDVRNQSLLAQDFNAGQLPAGPQGPKGDTGDRGPQGLQGEPGATGVAGYEIVESISPASSVDSKARAATCPAGKVAVGGGYSLTSGTSISASFPVTSGSTPTGWRVIGSGNSAYTVYVVCAN